MATMVDEIYDRTYRAGRADLHRAVATVLGQTGRAVMGAFDALHRIEWNSPWASRDRARCN